MRGIGHHKREGRSDMVQDRLRLLSETDYERRMEEEVIPFLAKYKKSGTIATEGAEIYYETYVNPEEKASIVISHGFCEFIGKFEEMIYYFFKEGYSVFMAEHRGHGRSSREKGVKGLCRVYVRSYGDYVNDLHAFVTEVVRKESQSGKLVLYAHSMGGAIGALLLEHYPELFACAILTSPMLQLEMPGMPKWLVWICLGLAGMTGRMKKLGPGQNEFRPEPEFEYSGAVSEARYLRTHKERLKDEHLQNSGGTYGWLCAGLKAVKVLQKNAFRVTTPVLVFQAEQDSMVMPQGQERFVEKAKNARLVKIEGAKHEIYLSTNEILEGYLTQIFDFFDETLAKQNI